MTPPANRMQGLRRIAMTAAVLLSSACTMNNPYYDPEKPHHTKSGFRNNYLVGDIGGSFLKWQYERTVAGLPKPWPFTSFYMPTFHSGLKELQQGLGY